MDVVVHFVVDFVDFIVVVVVFTVVTIDFLLLLFFLDVQFQRRTYNEIRVFISSSSSYSSSSSLSSSSSSTSTSSSSFYLSNLLRCIDFLMEWLLKFSDDYKSSLD